MSRTRPAIWLVIALFAAGCATSDPVVDTSANAEVSFDGLYPVKGGTADAAWARPDVDLSVYSKIKLQGVGIEYRPGGETGRFFRPTDSSDHYALTDEQKRRLEGTLLDIFKEELARSEHFELVDEAGPDVLLIRGGLLDVVSYVPPEPVGRADVYLSRVGEATIVLEIRDSESEAILARAVDRRAAEDHASGFVKSNRTANSAQLRAVLRLWARTLRLRLDTYGGPAK